MKLMIKSKGNGKVRTAWVNEEDIPNAISKGWREPKKGDEINGLKVTEPEKPKKIKEKIEDIHE